VLRVNLTEPSSGSSDAPRIEAKYRYEFAGKRYDGLRVGVSDSGGFGLELDRRYELLKVSKTVPCFVNPDAPAEAVLFTEPLWDRSVFFGVFMLVFGGVGLAGYASLIVVALRTPQPVTGTAIGSENRSAIFGMWAIAALWNCVSSPVLLVFAREIRKGNYAIFLALLFPLIGVWFIWRALHATAQYLKFGSANLDLDSCPGVIGGHLRGVIHVPTNVDADSVEVALDCIQIVTSRTGNKTSRSATVCWQQLLEAAPERGGRGGCNIPVDFTIPYECLPSSESDDRSWYVRAEAAVDGIDFATKFKVPVERTEASDPAIDQSSVLRDDQRPLESTIRLRVNADGTLQFAIPTVWQRRPKAVLGMSLLSIIWGAILVAITTVPGLGKWFFMLVFGFFELLFVASVFSMMFKKVLARMDSKGLRVQTSYLLYQSRRHWALEDLREFDIHQTSSSTINGKKTSYYALTLTPGDSQQIGSGLVEREAQWLADECAAALARLR
jgi:hypothetical protein